MHELRQTHNNAPLLELRNVSRNFSVRRGLWAAPDILRAVREVNLTLHKGDTLGLVGESGCGKSTLGRTVAGLLPPSDGEVLLDGISLYGPRAAACTGRVQMIFQDPFSSFNPRLQVGKSVTEPLTIRGMPQAHIQAAVEAMLALVGLAPELGLRYPHEFSGGQRQRLAVARALMTRPDIVVCDEPVSALDASVQAQVLNLLRDVHDRFAPAYLFISHDLAVVGFACQRIAVMYLGGIVEEAPTERLFSAAAHPYTQALLAAMPTHDPAKRHEKTSLHGELPSPLDPPSGCAFHPRCPKATGICSKKAPPWVTLNADHRARCNNIQAHRVS